MLLELEGITVNCTAVMNNGTSKYNLKNFAKVKAPLVFW